MNYNLAKRTHEPVSLLKILGRTATHVLRVHLGIDVGPDVNIQDLVNSRLQFSVLEDGKGLVGRARGHGRQTTWGTRTSHDPIRVLSTVTRHTFPPTSKLSRVSAAPPAFLQSSSEQHDPDPNERLRDHGKIYRIWNFVGQTYGDIQEYTRELFQRLSQFSPLMGSYPHLAHIIHRSQSVGNSPFGSWVLLFKLSLT
jgi:hypothetical protein